jgi:hypothetical protein
LNFSIPAKEISRRWRKFSKRIRGKEFKETAIPKISWKKVIDNFRIKLYEPNHIDGNVTIGELAVISAITSGVKDGTNLFEIGTFDGRTTMNLALNSPPPEL